MRVSFSISNTLGDTGSDFREVETPEEADAILSEMIRYQGDDWSGCWKEITPAPEPKPENPAFVAEFAKLMGL